MRLFSSKKIKYIFLGILLLAFVLRIVNLTAPDILTDEVFYSIRSIGFLDYTGSKNQSTPLDWSDPPPAWSHLSFHDHPPGVFLIQRVFFAMFGENLFASRLPFVVFGLLSVFLVYLIAKHLLNERAGLIAALFMSVLAAPVWLSRTGIMEAMVVFVILLCWYLFLKALQDRKYLWWWGVSLGLAFLVKYTTFILIPIFITYLLIYKRDFFKDKRLYLGILLAIVIFSPVIIYNINFYQATSHFDLQFSYLLGQETPEWPNPPGKPTGTYLERLVGIGQNMPQLFSPVTLLLSLISLFALIWYLPRTKDKVSVWLLLFIIWFIPLFILIGPNPRFLIILTPFVVMMMVYAINKLMLLEKKKVKVILLVLGSLILIYELAYSINTNWLLAAKGQPGWLYSTIRPPVQDVGINKLNKFIDNELRDKTSSFVAQTGSEYINQLINRRADKYAKGKEQIPAYFIYDFNLHQFVRLWSFDRRFLYQGIPFSSATDFWNLAEAQGQSAFGGLDLYYITGTENSLWRDDGVWNGDGERIEEMLKVQNVEPEEIFNSQGTPMFKVYRFHL